jgi:hypothetical protein
MVAGDEVNQSLGRYTEYVLESVIVLFISGSSESVSVAQIRMDQRPSLLVCGGRPSTVHHVTQEDHNVWVFTERRTPALAQIEVNNQSSEISKCRGAVRIRAVVQDLRVGDKENMRGLERLVFLLFMFN